MQRTPSFFRILQTSVVGLAVFAATLGAFNPPRAYAVGGVGDIVHDPINYLVNGLTASNLTGDHLKEYVLDPLAWSVSKIALQSITKSTVNWINSGFQGSPAFITDLQGRLGVVADTVASQFFTSLASNISVKSPFGDSVNQTLKDAYYKATSADAYFNYAYTLSQHSPDPNAFTRGNFPQGGFTAWFALQKCENNPLCTYVKESNELSTRINSVQDAEKTMLSWGGGVRSYTKCNAAGAPQATAVNFSNIDKCLGSTVVTPGSVIAAQVNKAVGAGQDSLVTADEFDEIIGALMGQLVNNVLGGSGLLGLSAPSSGGGASYINRATTPSQVNPNITQQFSNTIAGQENDLKTFQANWQKIQSEANAASSCSTDPSIQTTLDTAATELTKASTALSQLDALNAQAQANQDASGSASAGQITQVSDSYSQLINSTTLPSSVEITNAAAQAQDISGTLFNQMKTFAQTCSRT